MTQRLYDFDEHVFLSHNRGRKWSSCQGHWNEVKRYRAVPPFERIQVTIEDREMLQGED